MPRGDYELEIVARRDEPDLEFENAEQFGEQLRYGDTDEIVDKLSSMLSHEPGHPSHAQTLAARIDRLDLDDSDTDPVAAVFRTDLGDVTAAAVAASGHTLRDETAAHRVVSVAEAVHEFMETEVPERSTLELDQTPTEVLTAGGDCFGRTILYGSLLASAGIPFRSTSLGGGFPHSMLEVGVPCPDIGAVGDVVAATEAVLRDNGIDNPDVHWRYWPDAEAVFLPACTLYSEYLGDVGPLDWHGYVDHTESADDPDGDWGVCGSGRSDVGTWAYSLVLDVLGHYYDGHDLLHLGTTRPGSIGPASVRLEELQTVLDLAAADPGDPFAIAEAFETGGEASASLDACPDCDADLTPVEGPNYCFDCGVAL